MSKKLGRNRLCPCGSGVQFKKCCLKKGRFRRRESGRLFSGSES
ncbi:MAG TPA: SEC-C metal-binding domain-containing protein [Phycisphaerae bacterium]|nr:SEC-C metal-binding domain-containing protein [Phycisphaerae bacterium]